MQNRLFVADIAGACDFYEEKLGFETAFCYGDPPFCAQVYRQGARLNLRRTTRPAFDRDFRNEEVDPLTATIVVDDVKPLFVEFEEAGVRFHQPLRDQPWGAQTFIVSDPDGNLLCFAGAVSR